MLASAVWQNAAILNGTYSYHRHLNDLGHFVTYCEEVTKLRTDPVHITTVSYNV